jgi:hypothetical protein
VVWPLVLLDWLLLWPMEPLRLMALIGVALALEALALPERLCRALARLMLLDTMNSIAG